MQLIRYFSMYKCLAVYFMLFCWNSWYQQWHIVSKHTRFDIFFTGKVAVSWGAYFLSGKIKISIKSTEEPENLLICSETKYYTTLWPKKIVLSFLATQVVKIFFSDSVKLMYYLTPNVTVFFFAFYIHFIFYSNRLQGNIFFIWNALYCSYLSLRVFFFAFYILLYSVLIDFKRILWTAFIWVREKKTTVCKTWHHFSLLLMCLWNNDILANIPCTLLKWLLIVYLFMVSRETMCL